jgi:hypothetical protein
MRRLLYLVFAFGSLLTMGVMAGFAGTSEPGEGGCCFIRVIRVSRASQFYCRGLAFG